MMPDGSAPVALGPDQLIKQYHSYGVILENEQQVQETIERSGSPLRESAPFRGSQSSKMSESPLRERIQMKVSP